MAPFFMKQGDLRPYIGASLVDENGDPLDLTDASVTFSMRKKPSANKPGGGATVVIDAAAASVTDEPGGVVEYQWVDGDTDVVGEFQAEFRIEWPTEDPPDVKPETYPQNGYIIVVIRPAARTIEEPA